jgi:epoxyqueuosine reductase
VLIAIGNSGEPALGQTAASLIDDSSPLVRGMAVWAAARLLPAADLQTLAASRPPDPDDEVRAEWVAALANGALATV